MTGFTKHLRIITPQCWWSHLPSEKTQMGKLDEKPERSHVLDATKGYLQQTPLIQKEVHRLEVRRWNLELHSHGAWK